MVHFQAFLSSTAILIRPSPLSSLRCAFMSSSNGYESRAVQTTFSPPCSPCSVVTPQPLSVEDGPQSEISTSSAESSLETPNNPSQNSDNSLMSCLSTPDRSMTTSRRVLKTRLAPNFPSRVTHVINKRITSEPTTAPLFLVKSQIASQQRVVTMPEDIRSQRLEKEFVLYPPEYEDSPAESSNSFSISDGNASFVRADGTVAEISHSTSSPSSPDSVVIIQNRYHVSQAFLRQTTAQQKAKPSDDWMAWASSPPRPIPALHGPSSLPYARCPSGAEGTIIEEQDNLPRMIWGLDQDTAKPEIAPSETPNRTFEVSTASGTTRNASCITVSQNPPPAIHTENVTPLTEQKTYRPSFIEPIDLGPMLAPRIQDQTYQPSLVSAAHAAPIGVADNPSQQKAHRERHSNRRQELGVGLKPLPRRHEIYKNAKPLVTTQPVVGSSLPVIILESQPQSISIPSKRRQSAMEIAQQYRNTQALFQPVAQSQLPSGSSYSPVMQAIHLPTLSTETSESTLSNQPQAYNHSANEVYVAPSAAIDPQAISAYSLHHAASLSRAQKALASPGSDLGSYPRPPPNTPMSALAKSRVANVPIRMNHLPPSPDSPSVAIRSLQHSKAAPPSRLSHRRLSAVLEASEDQNVGVGVRPLSPPPFQQNFHLSRPLIPDGTALPPSYVNLAKNRRNYYYQLENFSRADAVSLSEDFAKLAVEPLTPSWIQAQARANAPLVEVDLQQAQRGHKANKAMSSGKARGLGQKNQPQGQAAGKRNRSKKKNTNGMTVIAA